MLAPARREAQALHSKRSTSLDEERTGGMFEIYRESEPVFFDRVIGTQSIFTKNDKAEVTAVILHMEGRWDCGARNLRTDLNDFGCPPFYKLVP
jgi:hypothetical protein